jgi:hypothetical protein
VLILVTLWSTLSFGTCADQLDLFASERPTQPIELLPPKPALGKLNTFAIELEKIEPIWAAKDNLKYLPDGEYIYLVTDKQEAIVTPQFLPMTFNKTGKGLATPKLLLANIIKKFGERARFSVVGSGEFEKRNGRIWKFKNQAKNLHEEEFSLQFSEQILRSYGLAIEPESILIPADFENEKQRQTPEGMQLLEYKLRLLGSLAKSTYTREMTAIFSDVFKIFSKIFPGQNPGDYNAQALKDSLITPMIRAKQSQELEPVFTMIQILDKRNEPEGYLKSLRNYLYSDEKPELKRPEILARTREALLTIRSKLEDQLSEKQLIKIKNMLEIISTLSRSKSF